MLLEAAGPTPSCWPRPLGGAEGKPASLPFPGSRVTHVPWLKAAFHHRPRRPRQAESPARPPSCFLVPASSSACEDRGRRAGHSWASGPALASPRHVARRMRPSRGPGHGRLGAVTLPVVASDSARPLPGMYLADSDVVAKSHGCRNRPPQTGHPKTTGCPLSPRRRPEPESGAGSPSSPCGAGRAVPAPRPRPQLWQPDCNPHTALRMHVCHQVPPFPQTPESCVRARPPRMTPPNRSRPQGPCL